MNMADRNIEYLTQDMYEDRAPGSGADSYVSLAYSLFLVINFLICVHTHFPSHLVSLRTGRIFCNTLECLKMRAHE